MSEQQPDNACRKILVLMPGLLGESVMATATLHALRTTYPEAHISVLVKRKLRPVLFGLSSVDRVLSIRKRVRTPKLRRKKAGRSSSLIRLGRRLSRGGFDTVVILPNSFKAAAIAAVAGIPKRVGYERDGRAVLLTDRLVSRRHRGALLPVSTLDSYLGIARYLGADRPSSAMHQHVHPDAASALDQHLSRAPGYHAQAELMLLNPGAPDAKRRWSPRRMAHLCELMVERFGVLPVVTGTPGERSAVEQLLERSNVPVLDLPELGTDLHLLKAMISRSRLMVTNDTGPRHLAAAMGVPLVTLFGPTVPQWSAIDIDYEQQVIAEGISVEARDNPAFAGPASLDRLHADEVFEQACVLYERTRMLRMAEAGV